MIRKKSLVVGLDIGTAKTTACVGSLDTLGRVEIHNATMVKTRGIDRGVITDMGEVSRCIEEVIKKTEYKLKESVKGKSPIRKKNIKIHSVYTSIGGEHILGANTRGMLNLSNRPVEITRKDTLRAVDSAKYMSTSIDREILHALAQEFIVDGYKRIRDPMGIYGTRLGVNLHVISGGASFVTNIVKSINRAGYDVEGVVYSGLASSMSTLTEPDKQAGVILLELGAGTVNIMFFKENSLQYTNVIPMGGIDISNEICRSLRVDFAQAEELKMQYKSTCLSDDNDIDFCNDKIIVKKDVSSYESITRRELAIIVEKKLDQILGLVKNDLELAGILPKAKNGIVICGGMSFMDGIIDKIEQITSLPVGMGIMRGFVSSFSGISNIFYSTGIGLIMQVLQEKTQNQDVAYSQDNIFARIMTQARTIYEEYF